MKPQRGLPMPGDQFYQPADDQAERVQLALRLLELVEKTLAAFGEITMFKNIAGRYVVGLGLEIEFEDTLSEVVEKALGELEGGG